MNNPKGSKKGTDKALRGGCWYNAKQGCCLELRRNREPKTSITLIGFRLAMDSTK